MPIGQPQIFSASYDSTTKIMSAVICVLLAVISIATESIVVAGIGVVVIFLTYAYSPKAYVVSDRSVIIKRLFGNVRIPLEGVRALRAATADDFRGCIRLWGVGGLFGYYGLFSTSKLGKGWWYLTNRRNAVVVVTDHQTTLFSPDDVGGFLAATRAEVPLPERPNEPLPDSQSHSARSRICIIGVGIAVIAIAFVAFGLLYSPGPPNYTLTATSLTIHDRFYPVTVDAAEVDVGQVRVVDIGADSSWRPTSRTNGFANRHYRSGWFRVGNGQTVRMYRADGKRLVILPPKRQGNAVLLEVNDPERFIKQVRQDWSKGS